MLTYTAGGNVSRSSLASASIGVTVGNVGLEGISYDPTTGQYIVVKEKTPQQVNPATLNFGAGGTGTAAVTSLFNPAGLGLSRSVGRAGVVDGARSNLAGRGQYADL